MFTFSRGITSQLDDIECPIKEFKITTPSNICTVNIDAATGLGTKYNTNIDFTELDIDLNLAFSETIYVCAITKGL